MSAGKEMYDLEDDRVFQALLAVYCKFRRHHLPRDSLVIGQMHFLYLLLPCVKE